MPKNNIFLIFVSILVLTIYFSPAATAQAAGLVPCNGLNCNACDIFKLVSNGMSLVWDLAAVVAAFMVMLGGFMYFRNKPTEARKILTNAVIGIAIVFFAWIGIDTFIKLLATGTFSPGTAQVPTALTSDGVKYGPWNKIECKPNASAGTGGEAGLNKQGQLVDLGANAPSTVTPYEIGTYTHAEACTAIKSAGIDINGDSCNPQNNNPRTSLEGIHKETIHAVVDMKGSCNCGIMITGGTEPGHSAGDMGHSSGYKVDLAAKADKRVGDPLSDWILSTFSFLDKRGDGANLYSDSRKCIIYADERSIPGFGPHWDILVKPSPPSTPTQQYPPCT